MRDGAYQEWLGALKPIDQFGSGIFEQGDGLVGSIKTGTVDPSEARSFTWESNTIDKATFTGLTNGSGLLSARADTIAGKAGSLLTLGGAAADGNRWTDLSYLSLSRHRPS